MKLFYLLLIVSLLQSCVVYYNTNDMRNTMNDNIAQIESNYSLTKSDYLEKNQLYKGLESNVLDKKENSFTLISKKKSEFDNAYQSLLSEKEGILNKRNQFEKLIEGKNEIKSNEKEWDELKEMKAAMKTSSIQLNKLGNSYASASNILGDAINKSQYKQVKRLEFNNQIKNNTSQLNQSLSKINEQIKAYNQKLEDAKKDGQINDSTYQSKMVLVTKMSGELNRIESAVKKITLLESSFQLKNKKNNKIWIGENTKSNELIKKIEDQISEIYKGQTQFKTLSDKLNEKQE